MVNTKIKLITFFVAEEREAAYSEPKKKKKKDLELTVTQIISFSQENLALN